ncbi:ABC transporter ATP-binding protein [Aquabacter sp. CN5-332]|uniref:ABC transporter ATP-binding protein n=1 Tax=Aquabacter sp. CN5-332 TaxID=3156608 RepID=UPI0032B48F40
MRVMIRLDGVGKTYSSRTTRHTAIGSVSLDIAQGEFVCVVGPSGCGKSTLLNMIAGFQPATAGSITVDGAAVESGAVPQGLGYLFQKDTVLPWLTVEQNVGLGLRFARVPPGRIAEKVRSLLKLANLEPYAGYFPYQISGGMRQRTALLMTLACDPRVLLLDEPFGALDSHTKINLHRELHDIWRQLGQTIVMVTHDLDEAVALADRVIVLSGPPSRVLLDHRIDIPHPRDPYVVRETDAFGQHLKAIWAVLGREYQRTPDGTQSVIGAAA